MQLRAALALLPALAACATTPRAAPDPTGPKISSAAAAPSTAAERSPQPPARSRWDGLGMKTALYVQTDHDSDPLRDQNARIVESIVVLKKDLFNEHALMARFRGSVLSSASYDAARDRAVMVSNATIKIKNPGSGEIGAGYTWHPGEWTLGLRGTIAFEYAYRSRGLALEGSKSWNEGNTTLSLSLQGYHDTVRNLRFDGTHPPDETKKTITAEAGLSQILSPALVLSLSLLHSEQWGLLSSSFGWVSVGDSGGQDYELAPRRRTRDALTARLRNAIDEDSAIELGYRYYRDDWGIESHTLNTQVAFYVFDRALLVTPSYRLYLQSRADFYAPSFPVARAVQTSDPDLGAFSGHLASLNLSFVNVYFFWIYADYDLAVSYYHRTDGLDMAWMTVGFHIPF